MSGVPNREPPPRPGASPTFTFPEVAYSGLPNGLQLRTCNLPRLPLVSLSLFLRAGEVGVERQRAGLAVLTGGALDGGTQGRDGAEMAEAFERIGARLAVPVGWEGPSVTMWCPSRCLSSGLALLAELIRSPGFPDREVVRLRDRQVASILRNERDPCGRAAIEAAKCYYSQDIPFSRPRLGFAGSVASVTGKQVRDFAAANYKPEGAGLVAVGDVEAQDLRALAEEHLGEWVGTPTSVPRFETRPARRTRRIRVVDRPGSVQSELRVGHIGASVHSPDLFALSLGNLVLGGMFSSRLNLSLRESHGYTYGIRSRFSLRSRPGHFQVSTSVGSDVTAPAVSEILAELERFAEQGATDAEVADARDFAIGSFGLGLETAAGVASRLLFAFVHGLPSDHFPRYRERLGAVTTEEVALAMRRHVRPRECQIIVVGDASVVVPPLEALGVGEVSVVKDEPSGTLAGTGR